MGHPQRFRDLIFMDGRSRTAPPTLLVWHRLSPRSRPSWNQAKSRKQMAAIATTDTSVLA